MFKFLCSKCITILRSRNMVCLKKSSDFVFKEKCTYNKGEFLNPLKKCKDDLSLIADDFKSYLMMEKAFDIIFKSIKF